MKIMNWFEDELLYATASIFKNKNNKEYYNVKVGSYTSPFIGLSIQLDNKYFKVEEYKEETLILDKSDYYIKPYKNEKNIIKKDKFNNPLIILGKTNKINNDLLIIPNFEINRLTFKSFTYNGKCDIIAKAVDGIVWFDKIYKYDINLLYIYGDCYAEYIFEDNNGNEIIYTLEYANKNLSNKKTIRSK